MTKRKGERVSLTKFARSFEEGSSFSVLNDRHSNGADAISNEFDSGKREFE